MQHPSHCCATQYGRRCDRMQRIKTAFGELAQMRGLWSHQRGMRTYVRACVGACMLAREVWGSDLCEDDGSWAGAVHDSALRHRGEVRCLPRRTPPHRVLAHEPAPQQVAAPHTLALPGGLPMRRFKRGGPQLALIRWNVIPNSPFITQSRDQRRRALQVGHPCEVEGLLKQGLALGHVRTHSYADDWQGQSRRKPR